MLKWRREPTVSRVDRPTRLDKARKYGYKARPGIVIARVRVSRGGSMNRERPSSGRRPKRMGVYGYTTYRSDQLVAEARAARRFPNMEVMGSYWVGGEDGIYKYFEVVLADRSYTASVVRRRRLLLRRERLIGKARQ